MATAPLTPLALSLRPSRSIPWKTRRWPTSWCRCGNADSTRNTASTASVTIALANNPGASTLSGTLVRAAVAGVATFSGLSLNNVGTGYTLLVTARQADRDTSVPFILWRHPRAPGGTRFVRGPLSAAVAS